MKQNLKKRKSLESSYPDSHVRPSKVHDISISEILCPSCALSCLEIKERVITDTTIHFRIRY